MCPKILFCENWKICSILIYRWVLVNCCSLLVNLFLGLYAVKALCLSLFLSKGLCKFVT